MRASKVSKLSSRLLRIAYQFLEFGNVPPLGAENIMTKSTSYLCSLHLSGSLRPNTLLDARHSLTRATVRSVRLPSIQFSIAMPSPSRSALVGFAIFSHPSQSPVICVKRRSPTANLVLTKHYSPSASADANRLSVHTSMEKCLLVEVLDGLKDLDDVR